jgi:ABC-2 type transport system permease protein
LPSPSRAWRVVMAKEWQELLRTPAFWVLLLLTGPLVGLSFAGAVRAYAEVSGLSGTGAGRGEAFAPLVGVWAPTFSAYELVAALLLPFLAIRVMAHDRVTGAFRLESQGPVSLPVRVALKAAVLGGAWLAASLAGVAALVLWRFAYGGVLYGPELASVGLGHVLNAGLTIALAAVAASITEHPATAAIVTLGFTLGTWVVSFAAAVHGGGWERVAALTPPALVAVFQRGLVRLDLVLVAAVLVGAGLALASVWMQPGATARRRAVLSAVLIAASGAGLFAALSVRASWDLSESRANSLPAAHEKALRAIAGPLTVRVHLAPSDARRTDLERRVFSKLQRAVPDLTVRYESATSVGLFEQSDASYGSIDYALGPRRASSRLLTVEGVLESVYAVADLDAPEEDEQDPFAGHPLAVPPRGAGTVFYVAWPALVLGAALFTLRRPG